jgi:hypothetical protein
MSRQHAVTTAHYFCQLNMSMKITSVIELIRMKSEQKVHFEVGNYCAELFTNIDIIFIVARRVV